MVMELEARYRWLACPLITGARERQYQGERKRTEKVHLRLGCQAELGDLVLHGRAVLAAHAVVVARELVGVVVAQADVVVAAAGSDLLVVLRDAGVHDAVGEKLVDGGRWASSVCRDVWIGETGMQWTELQTDWHRWDWVTTYFWAQMPVSTGVESAAAVAAMLAPMARRAVVKRIFSFLSSSCSLEVDLY